MPPARPLCLCLLLLGGCADAPTLDGRISATAAAAPYPELQPLAPLLARAAAPGQITPASVPQMNGSAAGLSTRAAALRGPVVDAVTRARMKRAIARAALR